MEILEEYNTYQIVKQPNTSLLRVKPKAGNPPQSLSGAYTGLNQARKAIDEAISGMAPRVQKKKLEQVENA